MDTLQLPGSRAAMRPTEALLGHGSGTAAWAAAHDLRLPGAEDALREGFRIGALHLMVHYEDGSELSDLPTVHRLPNSPDWFTGVVNLHGDLVPVFDPARRWGTARDGPAKPMLLVVGHGADRAGLVIDGLPSRLRWTAEQAADAAMAPSPIALFVRGAAVIDGVLWFDIDLPAMLGSFEEALRDTH